MEAYRAMERAVAAGKVRSIGLSNWYVEELKEFLPQVTIPQPWCKTRYIPTTRKTT